MNIPVIRILSPQLAFLGEIDTYTSLSFTRVWQGVGEWEFTAFGPLNPAVLTEGNYIMLDSDGHRCGIIRSVEQQDSASGLTVTVRGQTLNGLASQRCTIPLEDPENGGYDLVPPAGSPVDQEGKSNVPAESILKTYAKRHLAEPLDDKRKIPLLTVAPGQARGMKTVWMSRYEQLDGVLQLVGEYTDMGWEIYIDLAKQKLVFDVIPGTDRSTNQSGNSRVIFSLEFESVENLSYAHDVTGLKNLGYAGGAGEGADRIVLKVTNEPEEPAGLERFETFIDCGTLEVTETDTALSLEEEGKHKLQDYPRTESLTATIAQGGSFLYGVHWDLGDLVTVVDRSMGVAQDTRISQVTERYESGNIGLDVVFGEAPKHLNRIIRTIKTTVR